MGRANTHEEELNKTKIRFLTALSFPLGFLDAFLIYILSSYFAKIAGNENVGPYYFVAFFLVFVSLLSLQVFLRRFGAARLLVLILFFLALVASFLSLRDPSWIGAGLLIAFLAVSNILWVVLDIILEHYSVDAVSGRVRGLYLTIMNTGLLAAPFLSTYTLDHLGYGGVFTGLMLGYMAMFVVVLLSFKNDHPYNVPVLRLKATWKKIRSRTNLLRIYHISFAMEFFYAIMLVYIPLYLLSLHLSWEALGIVFTVMLVPFVLLQYPLGVLADTRWGERELLFFSLLLIAVSTFAVGMISSTSLVLWGAVLFLSRAGTAGVEVLRDAYFYKQIDRQDSDIITFFRTARSVGNIAGALLAGIFLLFFPLSKVFFLAGFVALSAVASAFFLEDTKSEREITHPAKNTA